MRVDGRLAALCIIQTRDVSGKSLVYLVNLRPIRPLAFVKSPANFGQAYDKDTLGEFAPLESVRRLNPAAPQTRFGLC